jgi:imidazolonepropionase-like amidohydrolase
MGDATLFTGGRLLDTASETVVTDATVLVEGTRVSFAGPGAPDDIPDEATEVSLDGRTIMPGLVDAHAHLTYTATTLTDGLRFTEPRNSLEYNTVGAVENARVHLERGVTSIRDIGARGSIAVAIRDAVEDGIVPGPRVRASGPILTTTGGLLDVHPPWLSSRAGMITEVNGVDEVIRAVREQAKLRVDNVKLEASGEWISPYATSKTPTMRFEEVEAAVEVAHARELTVAAHAKASEAIVTAADAGVDTIEHGTYLDDGGIEAMRDNDVALVGTLTGQTDIATKAIGTGQPRHLVEQLQAEIDTLADAVRRAHEAGITVLTGTDSGPPHSAQGNTSEEVGYLVERAGFTPMEALVAGTRVTAERIGLDDVGVLAAGRRADLLVVDGDPVADVTCLQDPENLDVVMKDGVVLESTG